MNLQQPKNDPLILSGRDVTAVLGPTNTGKTHLAIERMVAHESGVIGLPLRLLAREVYGRVCEKVGANKVALVTGEEKVLPPGAKYSVCTVEAMPRETDAAFVAIDEVQLAGDLERGHIFTDRILHLRGRQETLLLGAATMQGILQRLLRGVSVVTRPRLSHLAYSGAKKLTRLPPRSAIVAFSADEVYAIGELIRRQRGGVAVVLGALSPRTRNAQVAIYQSGDVDFLVATDAIGMGLNLDLDHVAFAQNRKFDGFQYRNLNASELGQIAGRAGRHLRDGTFGVTGQVDPFPDELVEKIESHDFDPVKVLQWRTAQFDFSSIDALKRSIDTTAPVEGLTRALPAVDSRALEHLSQDPDIRALATGRERVARLWEVCALPDYRKIAPAQHSELVAAIYLDIARRGHVDENYMAEQVRRADTVEGDIDTLSHRIAQIRTWTYVSNRPGWLADPQHWQQKTREIEDRLSDALHERLTKRFVDRRTSVLMRRLRENTMLEAEISPAGTVLVEGHHVGELQGFRFTADQSAGGEEGKAIKAAAQKALALEFESRAERFSASGNSDIALGSDGILRWIGTPIGTLAATEDALRPRIILLADEQLTGPARDKVAARAERFVNFQIDTALKPLIELKNAEQLSGIARGIAFQLVEHFGLINRREIADDIKSLDQEGRAGLRRLGVRFGAYHVFVPSLLKPGPAGLVTLLWALKNDGKEKPGFGDVVHALAAGRTSVVVDPAFDRAFYKLAGFRMLGRRAVRVDILERLADLIRPALAWKAGTGPRPDGAFDGSAFLVTPAMMSILGANADDIEEILKGLGYRAEPKPAAEVKTRLEALDQAAREASEAAAAKREAERAAKEAEKAAAEKAAKEAEKAATEPVEAPSSLLAGEVSPQATEGGGDDVLGSSPPAPELTASEGEAVASEPLSSVAEAIAPVVQDEPATEVLSAEAEAPTEAATPLAASTWKPDAEELPADLTPAVPGPESVGEAAGTNQSTDGNGAEPSGTTPALRADPPRKGEGEEEAEEPKPILLWRPARFEQRPRHHRQDNRQRRGQRDGAVAGDGKAQGDRTQRDGDRPQRSEARPPRENGGKERFERGKFKGKPNADGQRPDRRDNRPGDKGGFQGKQPFQARPPREERPVRVDPDSPFAKLAALRDQLKK
ncbi:helicase-related protein [Allomesorhizobium camelthorni]|uniref:Helicase n=1 Tax=Allomesorhizobium camelthorni TaxID=475069 RepID=A0A6G4W5V4_9HYPH|nr:helicase-related protein [Mesorhizobium camelthorni]NGO49636.1 helicase [Mesorhizobium camelthorni]